MKKDKLFIILMLTILNLIATAFLLFQNKLNLIIILPYAYLLGLVMISVKEKEWSKSLVKTLIILLYGVRMVIYPFLCIINNNMDQLNQYSTFEEAVFLQIYEYFLMIIFLMFVKFKNITKASLNFIEDMKFTKIIRKVMIILFIIAGIIIIIYPQILNVYRLLFFTSSEEEIEWRRVSATVKETMPSIIYHLGLWLINLSRIMLIYFLIMFIKYYKVNKEKKDSYIKIIVSMLLALLPTIITTDDRAGGFLATFVLLLLIAHIYRKKRRVIIRLAVSILLVIVVIIMVIIPTVKQENAIKENDYDKRINAYFSGTINIAAGLNMPTVESSKYIKGDILRYIPLVVAFHTDNPQSNDLFNQVLGEDIIYNSQIMPTIIQGYFYFGYILSPIFSIFLAWTALKSEKKANLAEDTFGYFIYTYMSIFFALGIILYYFSLTIYLILQYVFPMLCMYKVFKKRREGENNEQSINLYERK